MRRTVGKDRQDEFDVFSAQRTQVDADRIVLTFVNFMPLTKRPNRAVSDLILETINDVAVVGLVEAADQCLEAVARFDFDGREFSADQTIVGLFRIGQQPISLRRAILEFGRGKHGHISIGIPSVPRHGSSVESVCQFAEQALARKSYPVTV